MPIRKRLGERLMNPDPPSAPPQISVKTVFTFLWEERREFRELSAEFRRFTVTDGDPGQPVCSFCAFTNHLWPRPVKWRASGQPALGTALCALLNL